jgi:RNA polymerase-binding transcription factor DksA
MVAVTVADTRALLEAERERVLDQIDALAAVFDGIVDAADLVATDDEHDPEGHTIAFERQQTASLLNEARHHLAQVEAALVRVDDGTYGACETCGHPIGEERLEAVPAARECFICAALRF